MAEPTLVTVNTCPETLQPTVELTLLTVILQVELL